MGLADALAMERMPKGPKCSVGQLLESLPDGEAVVLADALGDPLLTGTVIARALAAEGYNAKPATVLRHRRGDCLCGDR